MRSSAPRPSLQQLLRVRGHAFARIGVGEQLQQRRRQCGRILDDAHHLAQAPGDIDEVVQLRAAEDRGAGGRGFQQVVPADGLRLPPTNATCAQA